MLLIYCNKCGFRLSNQAALPYQSIPVDEMDPICASCLPAKQNVTTTAIATTTVIAAVRKKQSSTARPTPNKPIPVAVGSGRRASSQSATQPAQEKYPPWMMAAVGGGMAVMVLLAFVLGRSSKPATVVADASTKNSATSTSSTRDKDREPEADTRYAYASESKPILESFKPAASGPIVPPKPQAAVVIPAKAESISLAQNNRAMAAAAPVLSDAAPAEKARAAAPDLVAKAPPPAPVTVPAPAPAPAPVVEKAPETAALVVALPPSMEDVALSPKEAFLRRQKAGLIKPDPPKPKLVLTDTELGTTGEGTDVLIAVDLNALEHPKGVWELQGSEFVCVDSIAKGGSLITKQSFSSCDIQFNFKLDTTHYLELYFGGWSKLVLFDRIDSGVWHEFKGMYRNGSVRATVDGRIQNLESKGDNVGGPISIFTQGGVFRIKDIKSSPTDILDDLHSGYTIADALTRSQPMVPSGVLDVRGTN